MPLGYVTYEYYQLLEIGQNIVTRKWGKCSTIIIIIIIITATNYFTNKVAITTITNTTTTTITTTTTTQQPNQPANQTTNKNFPHIHSVAWL